MLRTWLLGKETLVVREGHAFVAQLVYDSPGSCRIGDSRCEMTTERQGRTKFDDEHDMSDIPHITIDVLTQI